jgi:hypothetical protein
MAKMTMRRFGGQTMYEARDGTDGVKKVASLDEADSLLFSISTMKHFSRFLVLMITVLAYGCGGMLEGKKAADQGVADFHKFYNDGKHAEIYSASHSKFKEASTEKEFLDLLAAVERNLGKVT